MLRNMVNFIFSIYIPHLLFLVPLAKAIVMSCGRTAAGVEMLRCADQ